MPVPTRDASTVLPLRDADAGLEVFMIKRSTRLGFLGGAHVFPGGAVDNEDCAADLDAYLEGFDAENASSTLGISDLSRARGHYVAAIRELFEEAGILLARASGRWIEHDDDSQWVRYRSALVGGELGFGHFVRELNLKLATDALSYFAHWITPASEHKRFDTRFFLAKMPSCQRAEHDRVESVHGEWISPGEALARYARGEIGMVVPTICALDRLALHSDAEDALRACRTLDVVDVVPKIVALDEQVAILYPGDPDYDAPDGITEPGRMLNRRVLKDGLWVKP